MQSQSEISEELISRLFSKYISEEGDKQDIKELIENYNAELVKKNSFLPRILVSKLPDELYDKIVSKGKIVEKGDEINQITQNYSKGILPNINLPWQDNQIDQPTNLSTILPIRLINIKEKKVEPIVPVPLSEKKPYAILSHFWGERGEISQPTNENSWQEEWYGLYKNYKGIIGGKDDNQHPKAYKSLLKAVKALKITKELKDINYLWMDQLCIDQRHVIQNSLKKEARGNNVEQDRELLKMRHYYANSTLTLISIHARLEEELIKIGKEGDKIIKLLDSWNLDESAESTCQSTEFSTIFDKALDILSIIMRSEWRFSAWTYREGWLSKQTIFMFDDVLVDGRFLAMVWAIKANEKIKFDDSFYVLEEFRKKFCGKYATPIGWAYEEIRQPGENLITLNLNTVLGALIGRQGAVSLNVLRASLPLLPYGHLVEIEKWREWEEIGTKITSNYELDKAKSVAEKIIKLLSDSGMIGKKRSKKYLSKVKKSKTTDEVIEIVGDLRKLDDFDVMLFQKSLCDVMKVGVMNGYGEFLSWFGLGESNNTWLPISRKSKLKFATNMIPEEQYVYCNPGVINLNENDKKENYLSNLGTIIEFSGRITQDLQTHDLVEKVILKGFKEYDISKVGEIKNYPKGKKQPSAFFYRLNENNEIEGEIFSKRQIEVGEKSVIIKGVKEVLGRKQKWNEQNNSYEEINPPEKGEVDKKKLNDLKLLVPRKDQWKAIKIKDGNTGEVSVAFLVEKDNQGKYKRIGLVKLLDSNDSPNYDKSDENLNKGDVAEYNVQIEVWTDR